MSLPSDDTSPKAPAARPRGWLRATIVATLAIIFVVAAYKDQRKLPRKLIQQAKDIRDRLKAGKESYNEFAG